MASYLRLPFVAGVVLLTACGGGEPENVGPLITRSMAGDTAVVRTESGSVWGVPARLVPEVSIGELEGDLNYLFGRVRSIGVAPDGTVYVVDGQGPDLRSFTPDGRYRRTLGRPGEGPGELKSPDGGLAVLSDGRVLVRDPGNARIQVYAPSGDALETWSIRGGFNTSEALFRDREDNVYTQILVDAEADVRDWVIGLVRIAPDGTPGDTLVPPKSGFEDPHVEARDPDGHGASINSVPFAPSEETTLHPGGYFIQGVSTEYRFALRRPGDPLIIERVATPVPVTAGEKSEDEFRVTRSMRQTQPNWRWNGPAIPDEKPAFSGILAGRDGRIWVRVPRPGVEGEDLDYDPKDPDAVPDRWTEPVAFDVFEEDGTYLGQVDAPQGFSPYPTPLFDGDNVWAVTRDDLGVQRVVRYRIELDRP
ncbi:MAG TPA: hypothetical protein VLA36_11290 [Longimicrobiales bacterium]|nr:hypothetical protein [Longimicrobiales bacterium]